MGEPHKYFTVARKFEPNARDCVTLHSDLKCDVVLDSYWSPLIVARGAAASTPFTGFGGHTMFHSSTIWQILRQHKPSHIDYRYERLRAKFYSGTVQLSVLYFVAPPLCVLCLASVGNEYKLEIVLVFVTERAVANVVFYIEFQSILREKAAFKLNGEVQFCDVSY